MWRAGMAMILLWLMGCSSEPDDDLVQSVPLPNLPEVIELRAVQVVNPRFPSFTPAELEWAFLETRRVMQDAFGLRLRLLIQEDQLIDQMMKRVPERLLPELEAQRVPFSRPLTEDERARLSRSLRDTFDEFDYSLPALMAYARPLLLAPLAEDSVDALANALIATMEKRMQRWRRMEAADGWPVMDESRNNEWLWWDSVGYGDWPFDAVITNQWVASGEYQYMDVHSSLRGGVTLGTTSFSEEGRYGSWSWVSAYSLLNPHEWLAELGAKPVNRLRAARLTGAYLAHELGHQLLHLGHPFDNDACIMTPARLLDIHSWYAQTQQSAERCAVGSGSQMHPGVIHLEYRPAFVH